jgi:RHS repeat-associated protein
LKSVNGAANTYGYDGNGSRVRVTEGDGAAPTFYVRSSVLGQAALEVNATGVRRAYVYAGRKLVGQQSTDGQFYWLHTNHLGSSRAMTDVNGNLVYKGQFDPYGQVLTEWSSSGNANLNSKKFTGYERDGATGLDYANARMYNFGRGRFMQPDPNGIGAANLRVPGSLNRYSYAGNDPVNHVDPRGTDYLFAICVWVSEIVIDDYWYDIYSCTALDGIEPLAVQREVERGGEGGGEPQQDPLKSLPDYEDALKHFEKFLKDNPGCEGKIDELANKAGIKTTFVDTFSNIIWADARNAPASIMSRRLADFGETGPSKNETLGSILEKHGQAVAIWTSPEPVVIVGPNFGALGNHPVITAHEVLHIQFKMGHVDIAEKLGLGKFESTDKGENDASKKINEWLNNNCGVPR